MLSLLIVERALLLGDKMRTATSRGWTGNKTFRPQDMFEDLKEDNSMFKKIWTALMLVALGVALVASAVALWWFGG